MNSPIKTIIKNKSDKLFFCNMYPRYQIALKPCGDDGDSVALCGDIFTLMKTRQEMQGLMQSFINGTIDIYFEVDKIFRTSELAYNSTLKLPGLAERIREAADAKDTAKDGTSPVDSEQPASCVDTADKDITDTKAEETKSEDAKHEAGEENAQNSGIESGAAPESVQPTKSTNRRRSKNVKIG